MTGAVLIGGVERVNHYNYKLLYILIFMNIQDPILYFGFVIVVRPFLVCSGLDGSDLLHLNCFQSQVLASQLR